MSSKEKRSPRLLELTPPALDPEGDEVRAPDPRLTLPATPAARRRERPERVVSGAYSVVSAPVRRIRRGA